MIFTGQNTRLGSRLEPTETFCTFQRQFLYDFRSKEAPVQ